MLIRKGRSFCPSWRSSHRNCVNIVVLVLESWLVANPNREGRINILGTKDASLTMGDTEDTALHKVDGIKTKG